jgi:hypothetical protein
MARNEARLNMGHYPLPEPEARWNRMLLNYPAQALVIDPCVGTGSFQSDHGERNCRAIRDRTRFSKGRLRPGNWDSRDSG